MNNKREFSYYTYEVGRYLPSFYEDKKTFVPYVSETKKLVWNVIDYDFNAQKVRPINLFEYNWVFLKDGLLYAKTHYSNNFIKFADHVRSWLQHEYWSRSEYEVIVSGWIGNDDNPYKLDIYTQVMLNWDRFIDYVWNNKHLITKKKLGLD